MPNDEMQRLWKSQSVAPAPIDVVRIRARARKLHAQSRARNRRETIMALGSAVFFAWFAFQVRDPLEVTAYVLLIAAMLYVTWHLWRHGRSRPMPQDYGLQGAFGFYVGELTRQRDLLQGVMRWYLAPMIPGWATVVFLVARQGAWLAATLVAAIFAGAFWLVWWINRCEAARLNRDIAEVFDWEERS